MGAPAMHQTPPEGPAAFLGTEPVAAGPYYRDDYFELEREAVFRRCWLQIGHISELPEPGTFIVRPVEVAGASILITRGKDRAEARRVGKEGVSTCRSRWSPDH